MSHSQQQSDLNAAEGESGEHHAAVNEAGGAEPSNGQGHHGGGDGLDGGNGQQNAAEAQTDAGTAPPPGSAPDAGPARSSASAEVPEDLPQRIEAILLTNDRPISTARLGEWLEGLSAGTIQDAIASLNELYDRTGRSFRIEQVAGGWKVLTLPQYAEVLERMTRGRAQPSRLTPATMETLAIIAYKQPILRVDIEAIRGVACGEVLRSLLDMHLVKIVGRAEQPGRPMLYGTTRQFLEVFGLASLKDLPDASELRPKD